MALKPEDEGIQPHDETDPYWQESVFFAWRDENTGIGGNQRVSIEMNRGVSNMWCGVYTDSGQRFRMNQEEQPITLVSSGHGLKCGPLQGVHDGCDYRLQMDSPDCEIDLRIIDMAPGEKWGHNSDMQVAISQTNHYDVHIRVEGTARIGTTRVPVNGFGWRDHSCGPRQWGKIRTHRCLTGIFDDDLIYEFFSMLSYDGVISRHGAVIRDKVREEISNFELTAAIEEDGLTTRSADVRARLADGTLFEAHFDLADGVIVVTREFVGVESVGSSRSIGSDRKGFGYFAISNNPRAGTELPPIAMFSVIDQGLTERPRHAHLILP